MKHYSTRELLEVNNKAPLPVQEALSSETTISTISNLGASFGLHIDQIGLVAELNVQMLLGLVSPEEFLKELIAAKVPEKDAREIMAEINQKIFVPLRDEMRKGPAVVSEATKPAVPQQPAKPVALQASPQSAAATPPRPDWKSHASVPLPPRQALVTPAPPAPASAKPPQIIVPTPPQSQTQTPQRIPSGRPGLRNLLASITTEVPKSIESRKLLEDHEEPSPSLKATEDVAHIDFKNKAPATVPNIAVPAAPSTASVSPKPTTPKVPPPPAKPYSVDPYREPLDEK